MQISDEMVKVAVEAARDGIEDDDPVRAMRAALTAALALSGWRTIDSAPKDGTGILIKARDSDMPHTARYDTRRNIWRIAWDGEPLTGLDHPTHWKPLDAPPTTG